MTKLYGIQHKDTLGAALNLAGSLIDLQRFEEAKALFRKTIPVARRVLGDNDETRLKMPWHYARALYEDTGATLDDLREAVTTIEDTVRIARRVMGGGHPLVESIESDLERSRAALREAPHS